MCGSERKKRKGARHEKATGRMSLLPGSLSKLRCQARERDR
jgi:hypothetical protein